MITTTDLPDHYLIQSDRRPHLYLLVDKDEWEEWEEKLRGGERVSNDRRIAEANIRAENMRAALGEPATGGVVQRSEPWYEHGFRAGDPYPTAQQLNDLLAAAREEGRREVEALRKVAREMLGSFVHPGHPGEPCRRSDWISLTRLQRWEEAINPPRLIDPAALPAQTKEGDGGE